MSKEIKECNYRIKDCKDKIRYFIRFKRWYKPLNYFMYSNVEIKEWIKKYKYLLKINVLIKRDFLKNGNI